MKRRSFFGIILAFFFGKRAVEEAPQAQVRDLETERQKQNAWIRENYANFAGTLVCEGDSIDGWINSGRKSATGYWEVEYRLHQVPWPVPSAL